MTIVSDGERVVQFTCSKDIVSTKNKWNDQILYAIEPCVIACSNKSDAEYIQSEINKFINEISHKTIRG